MQKIIVVIQEDRWRSTNQEGEISAKCSKQLSDDVKVAAAQMKMKPSEFIRMVMKDSLMKLHETGAILLSEIDEHDTKRASGL